MKFLTQAEAASLDAELMSADGAGFIEVQLIEVVGLNASQIIDKQWKNTRILVCCGPGNNGADGMVAARYLKIFGHEVKLFYPKVGRKPLYRVLALF